MLFLDLPWLFMCFLLTVLCLKVVSCGDRLPDWFFDGHKKHIIQLKVSGYVVGVGVFCCGRTYISQDLMNQLPESRPDISGFPEEYRGMVARDNTWLHVVT